MLAIPGYNVLGVIGRGGMATVYRARQLLLDRDVALKVLSPQLTQSNAHAERFLQEARLLAALEHPHIVRVFDVGVSPDGFHYFSMQLLTGGDLGARLREGMSEAALVQVLEAVAQALGFAHARGYVHRDVTPANILFDLHDQPVLTDFGIARVLSAASRLTPSGLSIGTGRYMSPEQAQGRAVDRRADIYSLGVVTYEALSGHLPFEGEDAFTIAMAHVTEPVPPLPEECARWQPVIDGALAKDPAQRFADCGEFLAALQRALPDCFPQAPLAASKQLPRSEQGTARTRRAGLLPVALAALALLGVAGAAAVALWPGADRHEAAPAEAAQDGALAPGSGDPGANGSGSSAPVLPLATDGSATDEAGAEAALLDHELPTVRDPVPVLLALGDADLAARRLTIPAQTNALERYALVLRFDSDNARAKAGIQAVAEAYIELADTLDPVEDGAEWRQMLARAEAVAAAHPEAADAAQAAQERRTSRAQALLAEAQAASALWQRERALAGYRTALALVPGMEAAQRGLADAERIGKAGFGFADALQAGGRGPSMVLLGPLAIARTELSMADFRAYWDAAGNARFGDSMPSCRDRERGFLFGSSKRTWMAPDVPAGARHPVVCISHLMAEAYAQWLSAQTGASYRLPSAAEWRATRGRGQPACAETNRRDAAFRNHYGGREGGQCDDGFPATAPVASFAPRGPGLYDLDGNVREWVSDCDGGCGKRLALGGAWLTDDDGGIGLDADKAYNSVGVRLVREWTGAPRERAPD